MNTRKWQRRALILLAVIVIAGALLALDLTNDGLIAQWAWEVSGEEDPLGQLRGMAQYLASLTRTQPDLDLMAPVDHANVNPYGINTFWEQEPEFAKVEAQAQMIAAAGFTWIRQQFVWEDIEIHGKDDFEDRRNLDVLGIISAWDKYDRIVAEAEEHGLRIQARLDNPPAWSRSDPTIGDFGPPDDLQNFVDFAVAVAERYQGRIHHYQVWNEPNLGFEWGERPVDAVRYTELLCRTYDALKAVDPAIVVISGAIAQTIDLSGYNLMDTLFLHQMYENGAGDCFDVLSVQAYGLWSGPTDQRLRSTNVNIARHQYLRDIMVANGDSHKPIWISEAAWNFVPDEREYPDPIALRYAYGQVTQQQAADYIAQFYDRVQEDWPYIGVVNYWYFTRPSDEEQDQAFYYFRMVEPDYTPDRDPPYTPLPVYHALHDHIATTTPVLHRGQHQIAGHWAITPDASAATIAADGAHFGEAVQGTVTLAAHGTGLRVRWYGDTLTIGGDMTRTFTRAQGWHTTTLDFATLPETRTLTLSAATLDSVTVLDRTWANLLPFIVIGITGLLMLAIAVYDGLRGRRS